MKTAIEQSMWSRQVVKALPSTSWTSLQQGARPWLCLNGTHSETLEEDVLTITKSFDFRWIWRDTAWEYSSPGYRQGPLLVPLDEALYTFALDHWLSQQAGLILLSPNDSDSLVAHLQHLNQLTGSDGHPIGFSLHAPRVLEELCEGLPEERLSGLFGPIQRFIWYVGAGQSGEWLSADAPVTNRSPSVAEKPIVLTLDDEDALNHASLAWFMRDCVREFRQRIPAYSNPENEPTLWRHLNLFVREAADQLALTAERDVRHYVELRFQYPHEFFAKDAALRDIFLKRQVQGKQRLLDAEARLTALATARA